MLDRITKSIFLLALVFSDKLALASFNRRKTLSTGNSFFQSWIIPRGGAASAQKGAAAATPPAINIDWAAIGDYVKSAATAIWEQDVVQKAAHTSPADAVRMVGSFVGKQRSAANERRQSYQEDGLKNTTSSVVLSAPRALKLTLVAFIVAEVLQFLGKNTGSIMGTLGERAEVLTTDFKIQLENFFYVGHLEGGLLRASTWTNATALTLALQEQVEPKYQWAIGTAAGFVVSPMAWFLGWTALGWVAGLYVLAEAHHLCKAHYQEYYWTLKDWNNPVIYKLDDLFEDLRINVERTLQRPKEQIHAIRIDLDQRFDFKFPPHMQKGLWFGAIFGVITGV
mmetsp:Transcript_15861/g.20716  ORF Transcript_15861/g.20716 Transcript_15861/m.20716 type:complete len:339 (+) Transcript_15861:188-1204(+)|eukprot:CAMPEP_0198149240 /NCGR_PEP_ID=MMETSP1443-20131203/45572_1 /TAXON_ID=186043 /ORGANISM="Entomoneis sp., Strain CCMP2396" /LENGTH=338 /DNA_ID=CAMNT_0043814207 /DNA_START=84 /DNA_END=1100 /DNA_ORIENTATION=-